MYAIRSYYVPREVTISNTVTQPLCTGGLGAITNFVITGGSGDFSYEWRKNGALFETGVDLALIDIIDLEPGVYDLLLTDNVESDGALCTYQETITIAPISSVIQVGGTVDDPICHTSHGLGGVITSYSIHYTKLYDCSITSGTITIGEPANALIVSDALIVNNNCPVLVGDTPEGSATISISGGTPFVDLVTYPTGYDIKWESTGNSGLTEIELSGGTHKVTVVITSYSIHYTKLYEKCITA